MTLISLTGLPFFVGELLLRLPDPDPRCVEAAWITIGGCMVASQGMTAVMAGGILRFP
jgi:hypothetical protein